MNRFGLAIAVTVLVVLTASVALGLRYSQAVLVFGTLSIALAPVAIHKVDDPKWAAGLLMGLAFFASFPLKRLYQIDGILAEGAVTLLFALFLWVIGLGWRRSWTLGRASSSRLGETVDTTCRLSVDHPVQAPPIDHT